MKLRTTLAGLLIFMTGALASAQTGTIPVGAVAGTVVDKSTSLPLVEATVSVMLDGGRHSVLTDTQGYYALREVPAGLRMIKATRAGFYPSARHVEVVAGETTTADFVLRPVDQPPAGTVSGRVVDKPTSDPIAGARVVIHINSIDTLLLPNIQLEAWTDADGLYTIEGVPEGMRLVVANAEGYYAAGQEVSVAAGETATADFALVPQPVGAIAGVVVDKSTSLPLAEATVTVMLHGHERSVLTDAEGRYLIEKVPAGIRGVRAAYPGHYPSTQRVEVTADETATADFALVPIPMPAVGSISGMVVDKSTSNPIVEAHVVVHLDNTLLPAVQLEAWTDADGLYTIENVPAGLRWIVASREGYYPARQQVEVVPDDTVIADFALRPKIAPPVGAIAGQVIDAHTQDPIAGATVIVLLETSTANAFHLVAVTDEHGLYLIDGVPAGIRIVKATMEGYYPARQEVEVLPDSTTKADFALEPKLPPPVGSVGGQVVDKRTSEPIAGAIVSIPLQANSTDPMVLRAETDAHGMYLIDGVPAGWHLIRAEKAGYYPGRQEVQVPEGQTAVADFALVPKEPSRTGAIAGVVVDKPTSEPIAGAYVFVRVGSSSGDTLWLQTRTNEHGEYFFERVPIGWRLVKALKEGYYPSRQEVEVFPDATAIADFALVPKLPPPVGIVAGVVVDKRTSEPIAGARVSIGLANDLAVHNDLVAETNERGEYVIDNVPAGIRTVLAFEEGYYPARQQVEVIAGERVRADFALVPKDPPPFGAIAGVVRNALTQEPIARARVTVVFDATSVFPYQYEAYTNEHGEYILEHVPVGIRTIKAEKRGFYPARRRVEVLAGGTAQADFDLRPKIQPATGAIAGRVVDAATGDPIQNAYVFVSLEHSMLPVDDRIGAFTNEEGVYLLERVPVGIWKIHAFKRGFHPGEEEATVEAGATTRVNFKLRPVVPPDTGCIEGTVVDDETDEPIEGAIVFLRPMRSSHPVCSDNTLHTVTDANGQYRMEEVPAGLWTVGTFAPLYHMGRQRVEVIAGDCTAADFRLRPLTGCRNVRAIVRNARTHRLLAMVRVGFWVYPDIDPVSSWNRWQERTNEFGEAPIPDVPSGWQMMLVHKEGYKPAAVEVAVFPPAGAEGIQAEDVPLIDEQVIEIELEPLQTDSSARHWQLY